MNYASSVLFPDMQACLKEYRSWQGLETKGKGWRN